MKKITKAVIPVGGLGTRMLPATKAVAKEMLPIYDKPTLQIIVEECVNAGIEEIIFITNGHKKIIEDHFDVSYELEDRLEKSGKNELHEEIQNISKLAKIYYIRQGHPTGSGSAIALAKPFIEDGEYFAVLYGDDILDSYTEKSILKQMVELHEEIGGNIIPAEKMTKEVISKYNSLKFKDDKELEVESILEKPNPDEAPSLYCSNGRYIVHSTIFEEIKNLRLHNGEYYFSIAMAGLMAKEPFYACHYQGKYFDTGSPLSLLKTNIHFAMKDEEVKKELIEFLKDYLK